MNVRNYGGSFALQSKQAWNKSAISLRALAYSWPYTERGTFRVFIKAALCVQQLANVKICISSSLLVLVVLSLSSCLFLHFPLFFKVAFFLFVPGYSSIFLLLLFYSSKLFLTSIPFTERGGKVPDDKSQWECQRLIRKLVKSIANGSFSSLCTTCKNTTASVSPSQS